MITGFFFASIFRALLALPLEIAIVRVHRLRHHRVQSSEDTTTIIWIVNFAIFTRPLGWTVACVVADEILAHRLGLLTGIARTLVPRVYLAVSACRAWRTVASVPYLRVGDATRTAVQAGLRVAKRSSEFAIVTVIIGRTEAGVAGLFGGTHAAVLARRTVAEINFYLAVTAHVAGFAIAVIVVDELYTILSSRGGARIRETLVYVALAARTDETRRATTLESSDLVGARAVVVTRTVDAVVDVYLAYYSQRTGRTRAAEIIDEIVTSTAVLAGIRSTIVNVELAILSLEALGALALVRAHEILAYSAVLTRCRVAFVYLLLAVRSGISVDAVATMTVADVLTGPVVAQMLFRYVLTEGCVLAGYHLDVANLAGPTGRAVAVIFVLVLNACGAILARHVRTPVDVLVATLAGVPVWTVTRVVLIRIVVTGRTVQAR